MFFGFSWFSRLFLIDKLKLKGVLGKIRFLFFGVKKLVLLASIYILITILVISFMQSIYTYIPETNYFSRKYNVAAILFLLFTVLISLVPVLTLLYLLLLLLLLLLLCTVIAFSLGDNSRYTSADKTKKNKYT